MKEYEYPNKITSQRIAEVIAESGATHVEVGKVIKRDRKTVSNWVNCINIPNVMTLARFCSHYRVSADYLLGLSDEKSIRNR